ncbi:expressed unknown protein [Seminavis robusta]|uniref:Uncharacterized protein n=1 Tax=Seminavis robusta TaxID=568900 RepID=A0A9N8DF15_9STRA|nr:expressed unknown protein [Seminavis robusta]|eukprot:Sro93_g048530.1 n/a (259) ;mRNA; r:72106-72882
MAVQIINSQGGEMTPATIKMESTRSMAPEEAHTFENIDATTTTTTAMTAPISIKRELEDYQGLSNNTPKRRRTLKKQVHFGSFGDDSIPPHEQVHIFPRISALDASAVWYSNEEFRHTRQCDAHWVKFFSHYNQPREAYQQQLFQVLGAACGKLQHNNRANAQLANSPMRGLEREMSYCFRQRRKHVIANVLQSQKALNAWKKSSNADKDKSGKGAEMIASHYRSLALPSTKFAQLMAQGDALIVADMIKKQQRTRSR